MPTTEGTYSYNLPLELAVEAATEAVRVGAGNHYLVTATVVNLSGVPQVVLRRLLHSFAVTKLARQCWRTKISLVPGTGYSPTW